MDVFKEYLGIFVGFIGFMAVLVIWAEIDTTKKWTDIFRKDGRDD